MTYTLQGRIVNLFLPFFGTEQERRTFMSACWGPGDPLSQFIRSDGPPRPFTELFVDETIKAGRRDQKPYLEDALNYVRSYVGQEGQDEIDAILSEWQHDPTRLSVIAPYKGLESYEEVDQEYFFGRRKLIDQLADRIESWEGNDRATRFLAVVGASGSGKSSLVKAGLVPELKHRGHVWRFMKIRPGNEPLLALATQLVVGMQNSMNPAQELASEMLQDETTFCQMVQLRLENEWADVEGVLLVVDQFEELFTPLRGKKAEQTQQRRVYIDNLLYAAKAVHSPVRLIITLRADFYQYCADFDDLRDLLATHQAYIGPISADELREIIEEPPKLAGYQVQEGLTAVILHDLEAADNRPEPGFLPLLSHALFKTWEQRRYYTLMLEDYNAAGGVKGALRETADRVYEVMDDEEKEVVRRLFMDLTELGEDTADTRRRMKVSGLSMGRDPALFESVKNKLTQARLVVFDDPDVTRDDTAYAEISHEALIREWDTLREWLDSGRADELLLRDLERSMKKWEAHDRDPSFLYRGEELAKAEALLATMNESEFNVERVKIFLFASKKKQKRDKQISALQIIAAIAASVIIIIVATLIVTGQLEVLNRIYFRPLEMEWETVPSGEFTMGANKENADYVQSVSRTYPFSHEQPPHSVLLDSYEIGKYEVTIAQYRQCVLASVCDTPNDQRYLWTDYDRFPVTGMNWENASIFCEWIGGRLPTEAEWEKAAKGPVTDTQIFDYYPWGDIWDPKKAHVGIGGSGEPLEVGSFSPKGDSQYKISDMAGNVWEWTWDRYDDDYYSKSPSKNPRGPESGRYRVLRGGSFENDELDARTTARASWLPGNVAQDIGFRCVRELDGD